MTTIIKDSYGSAPILTVETVLRYVEPVQLETKFEKISELFSENTNSRTLPVVKDGHPVGLIHRHEFVDILSRPHRRRNLEKKPCANMMNTAPLLVDKSTPIHELSSYLSESITLEITDSFIITDQGVYIGIGTVQDLLREITKSQIESARHANPITMLPGYVPINEHIENMLRSEKSFSVCHGDLDNLKPFNEVCGYGRGDELILLTAKLLGNICDPVHDYIGHIGGDNFILVLQSPDWEQRCSLALSAYAHTSSVLFDKDHRTIGGYLCGDRQGRIVHHPLPTLSIGAICVKPGSFRSRHEIGDAATAAKIMAQKNPGNSLFVERRHRHLHNNSIAQHEPAGAYYYG
jgi:GGDEF domain-containing protein